MERTTRGFAPTPSPRTWSESQGPRRAERADALNPASRRVNRSLRAAEFDRFARAIGRDLNPQGPLERLVARQAVRSAWRVKESLDGADPLAEPTTTAEADRAARALEVAITTLDLLQARRIEDSFPAGHLPGVAAPDDADDGPAPMGSNEWPILPAFDADPDLDHDPEVDADRGAVPIWQDRLVYDYDVSDHSPIIKGTWVSVSHVVSLIVDGSTWADILRTHPELVEEDIRMCVAYAVAEQDATL